MTAATATFEGLRVGEGSAADASYLMQRCDKRTAEVIAQGHGIHWESVIQGNCFGAVTPVAGVDPGTALGTAAAFVLHNPTGSGKWLVLHTVTLGYVSQAPTAGTLGAGTVHICSSASSDAVPSGTAIAARNLLVGSSNTPVGLPYATATITTNAAKMFAILCALQASLSSTAIAPWVIRKRFHGEIVIAPGFNISIQSTAAAGDAPLVNVAATWEEVPTV